MTMSNQTSSRATGKFNRALCVSFLARPPARQTTSTMNPSRRARRHTARSREIHRFPLSRLSKWSSGIQIGERDAELQICQFTRIGLFRQTGLSLAAPRQPFCSRWQCFLPVSFVSLPAHMSALKSVSALIDSVLDEPKEGEREHADVDTWSGRRPEMRGPVAEKEEEQGNEQRRKNSASPGSITVRSGLNDKDKLTSESRLGAE